MYGMLKGKMKGLFGFWVLFAALLLLPSGVLAASVASVNGDNINVREGPGTTSDIVGELNKGDSVTVLEKSGDWYKVKLSNGDGWVLSSFLNLSEQNSDDSADWLYAGAGSNDNQVKPAQTAATAQKEVTLPEWLRPREGKLASAGNSGSTDNSNNTGSTGNSNNSSDTNNSGSKTGEQPFVWDGGELTKIDVCDNSDEVVVTVYATGKMQLSAFTIDNPSRLVLDLTGVIPGDIPSTMQVSSNIVQQVRTALYSKEPVKSRVVLDLMKQSGYKTTLSSDQKTLTVQLDKGQRTVVKSGKKLIAIDPGHGGKDCGAIGCTGLYEKDVTLDVSRQVVDLLKNSGYDAVLTRTDDTYVGLDERTDYANSLNADLFVSVHINSSEAQTPSGTSTHYRSEEGKVLSTYIQSALIAGLGRKDRGVLYNNFAVLRTSNMTSALAELAFISNPEEESLLKTADFRSKAAQAIVQGINNYYRDIQ
ncbi:N-acetylmuramoyl-L-alanine amidase [Desulfofarcimen acetoxidans DSM 771]|uniref:N-acetylmuramoyl-L-alanine amidase n=1 Tax=Desulfofarcimen acetoxidans (strain ATCC 49208 / DSM 771 / KCTC 5769 / VKM B-1644 / 5575) TaxID=485916 RepID=C8VWH4_DESAS|nr:N-acetylmuramoyl-L-alanine amidase [Desulfofarcimen acetoxidans]ACV64338.1 N-acetylmuramoyl-L-alanine amidase [Desulfofarcimen acetoxidans DSM 771]